MLPPILQILVSLMVGLCQSFCGIIFVARGCKSGLLVCALITIERLTFYEAM